MRDPHDIRVLVAEDDYLARQMIKETLREIGYTVVGKAVDGRQAVEMTAQLAGTPTQPDIILMDIKMPDMDGIEAARLIQERCPTPVVVLTAYETSELVAEASAAGVGAYLVKPPEVKEMERAITIALARFDDMVTLRESNRRLEEAQEQLIQQERLAAVGQLAAGIAHDFRNLLAIIILHAQMSLRQPDLPPKVTQSFEIIISESKKAADLVQQILDFSSRSMLKTETIDLESLTEKVTNILRRTIPENIRLTLATSPEPYIVKADLGRIQQALTNLATNARDAMPQGGELRFELSRVTVKPGEKPPVAGTPPLSSPPLAGEPALPPRVLVAVSLSKGIEGGAWVCLAVSDTGTGMTEEVQAHLFEPFFTTKEVDKRTGLGLAQVYGIVRQHEGYIDVETELGQGTTFRIYLPAYEEEVKETEAEEPPAPPQGQGETILLVEDNKGLREAGQSVLESLGYRVLAAANGREALAVYEAEGGADLVITDVVMPEMGGKELMRELTRSDPNLKALGITGYALEKVAEELREAGFLDVVHKPFDVKELARVIRRALAG